MKNYPRRSPALTWLLGAGAVGIGAALPMGVAWVFTHPPRRLHKKNPRSALGIPYARVRLRTEDGVRLSAWYVPAAPGEESRPPRGVVVICHGYYGNRETMLPYLSFLHRERFACLLFDFRAHGWSGGRMATFGISEALDLDAAIDWASEQDDLRGVPLAVLGESMGASVALLVASGDTRVSAVVADSAFARFDSAVEGRLHLAFGPVLGPVITPHARRVGERLLGYRIEDIAPVQAIARIAPRPVFLIHGTDDRLISLENAHRLHEAAPENALLWEVEGARHVQSVYVAGEEYSRRVTAFLKSALDPLQPHSEEKPGDAANSRVNP